MIESIIESIMDPRQWILYESIVTPCMNAYMSAPWIPNESIIESTMDSIIESNFGNQLWIHGWIRVRLHMKPIWNPQWVQLCESFMNPLWIPYASSMESTINPSLDSIYELIYEFIFDFIHDFIYEAFYDFIYVFISDFIYEFIY